MENEQTTALTHVPQSSSFEHEFTIIKNALFVKKKASETTRKPVPYQVVLLLSLTLGWLGIDRYYLGKIGTGILKTITLGGVGIWWIIDVFLILLNKQTDILGQELEGADEKDSIILVYLTLGGLFHYFYLGMYRLGVIRAILLGLFVLASIFGLYQVYTFLAIIQVIWTLFDLYLVLSGRLSHDVNGTPIKSSPKKYQSIAMLFSVFGGFIGMDRFYLGHRIHGLLKLFTLGGFGLWWLLDIVLIILNALKDVNGNTLIQE